MMQNNRALRCPTGFFIKVLERFQNDQVLGKESEPSAAECKNDTLHDDTSWIVTPSKTPVSSKTTSIKDSTTTKNIEKKNENPTVILLPLSNLTIQDNALRVLNSHVPQNIHQQALAYCDAAAMKVFQRKKTINSPTGFFIRVLQTFHKENNLGGSGKETNTARSTSLHSPASLEKKSDHSGTIHI
jgi:hypothetical protein